MITFEEFIKSIYYTQYYIIIPLLNRMKIQKSQFIKNNKYDFNKEKQFLKQLYDKNFT